MQSGIPHKRSSDMTHSATPFGRRRAIHCFLGVAGALTIAGSARCHDAAIDGAALRPSYETCVQATHGVTLALNDCIGAEHAFQDKRLNAAYQQLRRSLSKSERVRLRDEERAWIAQRDKTCAPEADGGTASLLDANQCQLDETAARAAQLEARLGH